MKIKELIVVEGKSDLIFLKSFLDAEIAITNGSAVSHETLELIKKANETRGVIILTDPDYPGNKIRTTISNYIGSCKHAYIERKLATKGKKIGVAETHKKDVLNALEKVVTYQDFYENIISVDELYKMGFIGREDSKIKRKKASERYHLGWCNGKTFLKRVNMFQISKEQLQEAIK